MKKVFQAINLTAALALAGFTAASGASHQQTDTTSAAELTSTCWLACYSFTSGVTRYKVFHVTESACCSGAGFSCPPGTVPATPAWGEPAQICSPPIEP